MPKNGPQWLVVLMLGVAIVLLSLVLDQRTASSQVYAHGSSSAGDRYAIVTGEVGSGQSCLWVLDSTNNTISAYTCPGGRTLRFIGTRPIQYEVQMTGPLNDSSSGVHSFQNLKDAWRKNEDQNK